MISGDMTWPTGMARSRQRRKRWASAALEGEARSRKARTLLASVTILLGALAIFGQLADSIAENDKVVRVDESLRNWLVLHRSAWLTDVMRRVTALADIRVIVLVLVLGSLLLIRLRRLADVALLVMSSGGAAILVLVAKTVIGRPRPPQDLSITSAGGYGFPFGSHCTSGRGLRRTCRSGLGPH